MEYEKVILEMLSRIQVLEEQVRELQGERRPSPMPHPMPHPMPQHMMGHFPPRPHRTNMKVTDEMLKACYDAGKEAHKNEDLDVGKLADGVSLDTGMNRNNALMTIYAVVALLNGELYKRGISGKATERYFEYILQDYGKGGLQKAIAAMRLHIDYRRALHHNVDLLETVCDAYQAKI